MNQSIRFVWSDFDNYLLADPSMCDCCVGGRIVTPETHRPPNIFAYLPCQIDGNVRLIGLL